MTQYLWDTSHYDGPLSVATLRTAHAQGIVALTHKVGEGTGGDDPLDGSVLANARDAGIPLLGGYHVVRSGPVGPQVDTLLALADRDEPWWRSWPGWFWQVDLERWPNDNVPAGWSSCTPAAASTATSSARGTVHCGTPSTSTGADWTSVGSTRATPGWAGRRTPGVSRTSCSTRRRPRSPA